MRIDSHFVHHPPVNGWSFNVRFPRIWRLAPAHGVYTPMKNAFMFAWAVLVSPWAQTAKAVELTEYEQGHVLRELQKRGWSIDTNPDGKVVKDIIIHRFPVFVDFERMPTFLNRFHKVT